MDLLKLLFHVVVFSALMDFIAVILQLDASSAATIITVHLDKFARVTIV